MVSLYKDKQLKYVLQTLKFSRWINIRVFKSAFAQIELQKCISNWSENEARHVLTKIKTMKILRSQPFRNINPCENVNNVHVYGSSTY